MSQAPIVKTTKRLHKGSASGINSNQSTDISKAGSFPVLDSSAVSAKIGAQDANTAKRYDACTAGDSSALKEALGSLVLVGDEIEYMQRVVVDQAVHSQETPVGAQPDSSSVVYQTLFIAGRNLDKLPANLNVVSGTDKRTAKKDSTSTAEAATYTFTGPLRSDAVYTVQASGTALPVDLHGNVTNPDPSIESAAVVGDTLTLTGEVLDLLPKTLSIYIGEVNCCNDDRHAQRKISYLLTQSRKG